MTHIGKIGRLPKAVREELNRRLENNELGQPILAWLNELPEVKPVLAELFDRTPVSKQNLSQWRKGGFREWQARQSALELVPDLVAEACELQPPDGETLADKFAPWVTIQYLVAARTMLDQEAVDRFKTLRTLCGDVTALRRADHRQARLKLKRDRLMFHLAREQAATPAAGSHSG